MFGIEVSIITIIPLIHKKEKKKIIIKIGGIQHTITFAALRIVKLLYI